MCADSATNVFERHCVVKCVADCEGKLNGFGFSQCEPVINQQMHICKCSITCSYSSPTCFGLSCDHHQGVLQQEYTSYNNNCKKFVIKPLGVTLDFYVIFMVIKYRIILSLKYSKVGDVYFLFCKITNKSTITINLKITTLLHVLTLLCHLQGAHILYPAKLREYINCSCW